MDNGWIKLHRKLLHNPLFKRSSYVHLWVYLLLRANHKADRILWNGGILDINPGQFITGRQTLSEQTGIAPSTVEDILRLFEKSGYIRQQKNNKFRLITIVKWDKHQSQSDNQPTSSRQQADTNKKGKNEKKYNSMKREIPEATTYEGPIDMSQRLASIRQALPVLKARRH